MDARTRWYYAHGGKTSGPVTTRELRDLATILQLGEHDLVWRKGMRDWVSADQVEGLFARAGDRSEQSHRVSGPRA